MKTSEKELKELNKELEIFDFIRNSEEAKGKIKDALEKAISLGYRIKNAEVKQAINEWYNDEKTCSGKPHCLIEECDLCVECFDELLQKLGLGD